MAIQKNKIYRAEIVDYTAEGSGVARIEGMAVFVPKNPNADHAGAPSRPYQICTQYRDR